MNLQDIYKLKLNESINATKPDDPTFCEIRRVPGGWIYTMFDPANHICGCVFVPFNNEFQDVK